LARHIGAGLHQRNPELVVWEPLSFFSKNWNLLKRAFINFAVDRELLASSAGICHFGHMFKGTGLPDALSYF
jgi:hypothetical protein